MTAPRQLADQPTAGPARQALDVTAGISLWMPCTQGCALAGRGHAAAVCCRLLEIRTDSAASRWTPLNRHKGSVLQCNFSWCQRNYLGKAEAAQL